MTRIKHKKVLGHQNLRTTEIYLHDLDVDRGAAEIFENITNEITNGKNNSPESELLEEKFEKILLSGRAKNR